MDGSQGTPPVETRRKRFSAADVQAMLKAGVLKDGEHVELLWGELVEMSPQGPLHWNITQRLVAWLLRNLPLELTVASQVPLRLGEYHEPEPEIFVYPDRFEVKAVRGPDVLLVVEVAFSSLDFDLKVKGPLYAEHGVREYWVVDVEGRRTLVHRLGQNGYGEPQTVAFDQPLTAPGGLPVAIADLAPKG